MKVKPLADTSIIIFATNLFLFAVSIGISGEYVPINIYFKHRLSIIQSEVKLKIGCMFDK